MWLSFPAFLLFLFLPVLFLFEFKGLSLQKSFIKSKNKSIKEKTIPREIYLLHDKIKTRRTINFILACILLWVYLLAVWILFFSFVWTEGSTEPGMEMLFYRVIAFGVLGGTEILLIIYTIMNYSTYAGLKKYFSYFQSGSK